MLRGCIKTGGARTSASITRYLLGRRCAGGIKPQGQRQRGHPGWGFTDVGQCSLNLRKSKLGPSFGFPVNSPDRNCHRVAYVTKNNAHSSVDTHANCREAIAPSAFTTRAGIRHPTPGSGRFLCVRPSRQHVDRKREFPRGFASPACVCDGAHRARSGARLVCQLHVCAALQASSRHPNSKVRGEFVRNRRR